jgi:hypothetical protein
VSVAVAFIYIRLHPDLSWQQAMLHAGIILGLFQVTPVSPGSLARGLYVSYLILRERNFKDYNIAFSLSFLKYIGYLAFPIQMAYRYPELARFMASHWATGAVHIVPVFGERGALLEHIVFDLFYNYPLNIRRRIRQRKQRRAGLRPRSWHVSLCVLAAALVLALADVVYFNLTGRIPTLGDVWWLAIWVPLFAAGLVAAFAGGASLSKRMKIGALSGILIGILYATSNTLLDNFLAQEGGGLFESQYLLSQIGLTALWRIFLFAILALIGVFIAETRPLKPKSAASTSKSHN